MIASNRVGEETIQTEHGPSKITFYGTSFIAGEHMLPKYLLLLQFLGFGLFHGESARFFFCTEMAVGVSVCLQDQQVK